MDAVADDLNELSFRESVFAKLRARMLVTDAFTREELSDFDYGGRQIRLVGTQTGIWRVKEFSDAAISILTSFVPNGGKRPYNDSVGDDGLLRYKWPVERLKHRVANMYDMADRNHTFVCGEGVVASDPD